MRLIDADEFCNKMKIRQDAAYKHSKGSDSSESRFTESDLWDRVICGFVEAKLVMDSIPTVDAVPVVRCADCEMSEEKSAGRLRCKFWRNGVMKDWYCFEGKKRRNEDATD